MNILKNVKKNKKEPKIIRNRKCNNWADNIDKNSIKDHNQDEEKD